MNIRRQVKSMFPFVGTHRALIPHHSHPKFATNRARGHLKSTTIALHKPQPLSISITFCLSAHKNPSLPYRYRYKELKMHLPPILSFAIALTLAATAFAHDDEPVSPPSSEVQITGFVFGGSGCTGSSVSLRPAPNSSSLPILEFDAFNAYSGRNISASSYRRNCQINVKIKHLAGWQFSVSAADYRGYALVPAGMTGLTKATYYFSGERAQVRALYKYPLCFGGCLELGR